MTAPPASLPSLPDYGTGVYRRRIRLERRSGRVVGELQDDFHHFAVDLQHDGAVVTGARGGGLRTPWTTCGGAIPPLERLQGLALTSSLRKAPRHTDPRQQCTHLFDLASLAVAHAARAGEAARVYDVSIPDRVEGRTSATLDRDGERLLEWALEGSTVAGPDPFAGRALSGAGFGEWAETLGPDPGEAVQVLRRAVFISMGRRWDFDRMRNASQFAELVGGACHTFSREQIGQADRMPGTRRDFGREPGAIFMPGFSAAFEAFDRAGGT